MCRQVSNWITENVLTPVTRFITEAQESCEEVRQWVEQEVEQPVDQWISRQEQQCTQLPWWNPLGWFCVLVMVLVKVVVWVVVVIGKWVVTTVCQVVTIVVGAITTLVLRVVGWAVTFTVCLFTDPGAALASIWDLWTSLLDFIEDIFDLIDALFSDLMGVLTDLEELVDSLASSLGWLGAILGILKGLIQLARELVSILRDATKAGADLLAGLYNANPCDLVRGFTDLGTTLGRFFLGTGFVFLAPVRVIGAAVGGVRDEVNQHELERVIRTAINSAFGRGSARALRALDKVGLNARPMGLPFQADARRMFISSDDPELNAKMLHDSGAINLWTLAGYTSDCEGFINEPQGEVVYAGTDLHVSSVDIRAYLKEGPGSVPTFHVFPITRAQFREHLDYANRKAAALGLKLHFPTIGQIQATSPEHVPLNSCDKNPPGKRVQNVLFQTMGRTGMGDDLSIIPIISHFHYILAPAKLEKNRYELFGLTTPFEAEICDDIELSGVTYRNLTPDWVFRSVLAHELGHYWGLDHKDRAGNDRSPDQIMFTPDKSSKEDKDKSAQTALYLAGVPEYLLLGGEPRFTLDDARTTWEWITTRAFTSLMP